MKKISLSIAALAVVLAVTFTSCKKDDASNPVVSITGDGSIELPLGGPWVDPGATATDDNDGAITPTVTGTVDVDKVGEYTITYKAIDEAGNEGTATRTVKVEADKLAAIYDVVETYGDASTSTHTCTVGTSTIYNKVTFTNFGGFGTQRVFDATVTSTGISIADQSFSAEGEDNQIVGATGVYSKVAPNYNVVTFTYTWKNKLSTEATWTTDNITQVYTARR